MIIRAEYLLHLGNTRTVSSSNSITGQTESIGLTSIVIVKLCTGCLPQHFAIDSKQFNLSGKKLERTIQNCCGMF
uniref:Uncharacterized protein n=1 Tax=Anguilla anguilla TaxID=7936 RepID=A0A0E9PYV7_ANGAN